MCCSATKRSASGYGDGRSSNVSLTLNIVVEAPIPSASIRTADAEKNGAWLRRRNALRRSASIGLKG